MAKSIYVHIPFCEHICHYCDFNKFYLKNQPVDEYIDALLLEMEEVSLKHPPSNIQTIYIGGGTPTALNANQLEKVVLGLKKYFSGDGHVREWTVEVNPGGVTLEQLEVLYENGVNRLSIGVQTFSNELLEKIGRTHQVNDVLKTIELARRVGFSNLSVDLMFGLPHETLDIFQDSLKQAFTLGVEHFSAYSLKIEEKTVFYNLQKKGKLSLPHEEIEVAMYECLMNEMEARGYQQYEISNFAKFGYESKHNLTYWDNAEYYGLGAGAHGYLNGVRYANMGPVNKYIALMEEKRTAILDEHKVSVQERMEEQMFLGLRKSSGVSPSIFKTLFDADVFDVYSKEIDKLVRLGWITANEESIHLTKKGLLVANEVFEAFLLNE